MLRVPLDQIRPGMVLARPIPMPNHPYKYLVQRDREIPAELIPRLRQWGVHEVWVRHQDFEFLEGVIDEGLTERQREVYQRVRQNFEAIVRGSAVELDLTGFQDSIRELFEFLKRGAAANVVLQKLDAYDDYLLAHSVNTCYLALLLGMSLDRYLIDQRPFKAARQAKELHLLGLGALLHDIGKLQIPPEILNKPGKLDPEEFHLMRRHTVLGYQMIRHTVPPTAAQVALNHHQRWDGSGYPGRVDSQTGQPLGLLSGTQIPIFSRIVTVADVYDAATTHRSYCGAKLPVQAIYEMRTQCLGFFDPVVEAAFYRIVPPFPIGQIVTLSNGFRAAVVDFNRECPLRPKVQCLYTPEGQRIEHPSLEEIDLSLYPELAIVAVDGQDVRPFVEALESLEPADALV